jgi:hypothetical protein
MGPARFENQRRHTTKGKKPATVSDMLKGNKNVARTCLGVSSLDVKKTGGVKVGLWGYETQI